jgi:hypothetical protein
MTDNKNQNYPTFAHKVINKGFETPNSTRKFSLNEKFTPLNESNSHETEREDVLARLIERIKSI